MKSVNYLTVTILLFISTVTTFAENGPIYFQFTSNTGNNATVILPKNAKIIVNGVELAEGDEIGAFSPDSLCVGAAVWENKSTAITVWGNNEQTSEVDGIKAGQEIHFRVWKKNHNSEYIQNNVWFSEDSPVMNKDGVYSPDRIFMIDSLFADTIVNVNINNMFESIYSFELAQNYPNPFNPETTIGFSVQQPGHVRIVVYNQLGQTILTLVDGYHQPGKYEIQFHAGDLPSGFYLYRMETGNYIKTKKFILLK